MRIKSTILGILLVLDINWYKTNKQKRFIFKLIKTKLHTSFPTNPTKKMTITIQNRIYLYLFF